MITDKELKKFRKQFTKKHTKLITLIMLTIIIFSCSIFVVFNTLYKTLGPANAEEIDNVPEFSIINTKIDYSGETARLKIGIKLNDDTILDLNNGIYSNNTSNTHQMCDGGYATVLEKKYKYLGIIRTKNNLQELVSINNTSVFESSIANFHESDDVHHYYTFTKTAGLINNVNDNSIKLFSSINTANNFSNAFTPRKNNQYSIDTYNYTFSKESDGLVYLDCEFNDDKNAETYNYYIVKFYNYNKYYTTESGDFSFFNPTGQPVNYADEYNIVHLKTESKI